MVVVAVVVEVHGGPFLQEHQRGPLRQEHQRGPLRQEFMGTKHYRGDQLGGGLVLWLGVEVVAMVCTSLSG